MQQADSKSTTNETVTGVLPTRRRFIAGLAVGSIAVNGSAAAFAGQEIDDLWTQRLAIIRASHENHKGRLAAYAKLPAWAQSGERYIDHLGNRCGGEVGWPERAILPKLPKHPGTWMIARQSPQEIREHFENSVSTFTDVKNPNSPARKKLRADYRAAMRRMIDRLREQREEERLVGMPMFDQKADELSQSLYDIEARISDLPDCPNVLAARIMIRASYDTGNKERVKYACDALGMLVMVLRSIRGTLVGTVRRSADDLLDNPERPFGEAEIALA